MKRFIETYDGRPFDVVVAGGGISGAAVAYDAASRGLSVALLEKEDFGGATSAATSKLIHGGIRYLANGELGLVRQSLRERRTLSNIAPNLVYPQPVMVTLYGGMSIFASLAFRAGMTIYDLLSFDRRFTWDKSKKLPRHKMLSSRKVLQLEPSVSPDGLRGAAFYFDCLSLCPERLTLAFLKSAVREGAKVSNYAKVVGFLLSGDGRINGVKVTDLISNRDHEIKAELVINCAGPWADIVLDSLHGKGTGAKVRRSEGIHVITRKLVGAHMVASASRRGNPFFLIPWRDHTLIGTTDREYVGDPDDFRVTRAAIEELLEDVNDRLNAEPLRYEDVLYTYGGLRPLLEDQTKGTRESSRRYEIYDNGKDGFEGLITVMGGKYTTSRGLAENVMKMVGQKLNRHLTRCVTAKQYLASCDIKDINAFMARVKSENSDFEDRTLDWLGRHYGTEYQTVIDLARSKKSLVEVLDDDGEIAAQVVYAIRQEMALTLNDILLRRTGLGTLGDPGDSVVNKVADLAAKELGWDSDRKAREIRQVREAMQVPI
jgi:glycerol-3-phosphate dehydrogenase